jgi:phage gp36-like protein
MSYLTIDEIKTHLYGENVEVISRGDDTLMISAIDSALAEAKGYLTAYDINAEFQLAGENRNALLVTFLKDIAVWHFINLCNAGTDLELRQDRYERAIDWLESVQKGYVVPDLPALEAKTGQILFSSNHKRQNHF